MRPDLKRCQTTVLSLFDFGSQNEHIAEQNLSHRVARTSAFRAQIAVRLRVRSDCLRLTASSKASLSLFHIPAGSLRRTVAAKRAVLCLLGRGDAVLENLETKIQRTRGFCNQCGTQLGKT